MIDDLISRQAMLDGIDKLIKIHFDRTVVLYKARKVAEDLPSAQPEPETISKWKKEFREYVDSLDIARDDWKGIIEYIDELPSAQPERKAGHWKHINEEEEWAKHNGQLLGWMPWYCSECGCGVGKHQTAFCPNCGADMRGDKHETD